MSGTGGGPSKFCSLTATEEQVVALLSIDEAINGEAQTVRFGANPPSCSFFDSANSEPNNDVPNIDAENQNPNPFYPDTQLNILPTFSPPNALPTNTPPTRPRSVPPGRDNLLRYQVENQCKYHENSVKKLDEISNSLSSLSNYFRKNVELEEAKHQLEREKFEFLKKNEKKKHKLKLKQLKFRARCKY